MEIPLIVRALRSRNYRLFFIGQLTSLVGTWMQNVAMSWMVYRMTGSALMLGTVSFSSDIFAFLLIPYAGVLADKLDRRRMLITIQSCMLLQAVVLAALVLGDLIQIWHIFVLAMILGVLNAFDMPTRHSFVIEMLEDKSDLQNAIALNSSMFNAARLLGPSVAGVLIAVVGEGYCFLFNACSYCSVLIALSLMKLPKRPIDPIHTDSLRNLREGFSYTFGFLPIRNIILLVSITSLMGYSYVVLMPIIARDVLFGGPKTLGFLMSAAGCGALIAAICLAARKNIRGVAAFIPASAALFGCAILALALSRHLFLSLPAMFFIGVGLTSEMACSNTIVQTVVDNDKRGRVMGIYAMAFRGIAPFGSLLAGFLASKIGATHTLIFAGCCLVLGAGLFARQLGVLMKMIKPIYLREGILTEGMDDESPSAPPSIPPESSL